MYVSYQVYDRVICPTPSRTKVYHSLRSQMITDSLRCIDSLFQNWSLEPFALFWVFYLTAILNRLATHSLSIFKLSDTVGSSNALINSPSWAPPQGGPNHVCATELPCSGVPLCQRVPHLLRVWLSKGRCTWQRSVCCVSSLGPWRDPDYDVTNPAGCLR